MTFSVTKGIFISVRREICSKPLTDNQVNEQVKIMRHLRNTTLSADNLNWKIKSLALTKCMKL
jgi:hypothetical protein